MPSSSSSSSDDGKKKDKKKKEKKKEKEKKEKKATVEKAEKGGKKDKKESKTEKDEKEKKRLLRALGWDFDRRETVRLIRSLLALDETMHEDLTSVFEAIDDGDVVNIDGLENLKARKKLRHLMQAMRMTCVEGQGFKTADKKASFVDLFQDCLLEAAGGVMPTAKKAPEPPPAPEPQPEASPEPSPDDNEEKSAFLDFGEVEARPPPKRRVGPQLPGACVGPAVGGEDESDDDDPDRQEPDAGPKLEGEREGVDLNDMPEESAREEWMRNCPAGFAAAFGDVKLKGKMEIRRSKADQEKFEKMFADRGPSLLKRAREGEFSQEEVDKARQKKVGVDTSMWGQTSREQERGGAQGSAREPHKAFDPERDMRSSGKPMDAQAFDKLVENSVGGLAGRFGRGQVATSFL